jgi:hypothetical protein
MGIVHGAALRRRSYDLLLAVQFSGGQRYVRDDVNGDIRLLISNKMRGLELMLYKEALRVVNLTARLRDEAAQNT